MFCKNCGKGLQLNPGNTCPKCGSFLLYCRSCGKGLELTPDKTCAGCGTDGVKATSFCRYCGKPTTAQDPNCPACGSASVLVPGGPSVPNKKVQRFVTLSTIGVAFITLGVVASLPSVNKAVLTWVSTFKPAVPKPDFSKNVTVDLVMQNGTFFPNKIYAEAGANLFINFTNKDVGVEHNFVLYREVEAYPSPMSIQKHILGPGTAVYKVKVPRFGPDGAYWFACDNHYATEQGLFYTTWPTP